jgi:hypothetical protein
VTRYFPFPNGFTLATSSIGPSILTWKSSSSSSTSSSVTDYYFSMLNFLPSSVLAVMVNDHLDTIVFSGLAPFLHVT